MDSGRRRARVMRDGGDVRRAVGSEEECWPAVSRYNIRLMRAARQLLLVTHVVRVWKYLVDGAPHLRARRTRRLLAFVPLSARCSVRPPARSPVTRCASPSGRPRWARTAGSPRWARATSARLASRRTTARSTPSAQTSSAPRRTTERYARVRSEPHHREPHPNPRDPHPNPDPRPARAGNPTRGVTLK